MFPGTRCRQTKTLDFRYSVGKMSYPIKVVARRTGITEATLRAWERRYAGIKPERDEIGRRRYSAELTNRLALFAQLIDAGYRIGQIVDIGLEQLQEMAREESAAQTDTRLRTARSGPHAKAIAAVERLDYGSLYVHLETVTASLGRLEIADKVIFPMQHEVDELVKEGALKEIHRRFLAFSLRTLLSKLLVPTDGAGKRPNALLLSPLGDGQDIGLVTSAVHAYAAGWNPIVVGTRILPEEVVESGEEVDPKAYVLVVNSDLYDFDALDAAGRLRSLVPATIPVYFGGKMPAPMVKDLEASGLLYLRSMDDVRVNLQELAVERLR